MNHTPDRIVIEWAELSEFTRTVMAWAEYQTESSREHVTHGARKLDTVMRDPEPFARFADWLDQDETGRGQTR